MTKSFLLTARVSLLLTLVALIQLCWPGREALAQEQILIEPGVAVRVTGLLSAEPKKELRKVHRHTQDAEALANLKAQHKAGGAPALTESVADISLASPSVFGKLPGIQQGQAGGFIPPDSQIAAGPQHIVEAVNLLVRIWSKGSPPVVIASFDLGGFLGVDDSVLSDPKIRFDPQSSRWYIAAISFPKPTGAWHLAVSTTDDPTGDFVVYTVSSATGTLPDFTAMGMSDDKVVLSGNAFRTTGSGQFRGTEYVVLNKADLVAGATAHAQFFGPPQGLFTIQPATTLPSTTGSTTALYMAAVAFNSSSTMRVWSLTGVPGVGNGVQVNTTTLQIPTLSSPPDAQQAGTANLIVTNDNSLLDVVVRNGALWVAANSACIPAGDQTVRACLRLMQVRIGTTLSLAQAFDVGAAGWYYYYPAIQVDGSDNLLAAFSGSSASSFASVYAGGQTAGTTNAFSAPRLIKAGKAAYQQDRWGDYSGIGMDTSDQTAWIAGEFARSASAWGTHIAEIGF